MFNDVIMKNTNFDETKIQRFKTGTATSCTFLKCMIDGRRMNQWQS